jgi:hypothetical protein
MPLTYGSYEVSDAYALDAVLAFDEACLAHYDFGGNSVPDRVDAADIGRLVGSQMVGVSMKVAATLIELGETAPWAAVPIDARLEDAGPKTELLAAAEALRSHFEHVKHIKSAISTKLLAMKRPALFPVIDVLVWNHLYGLAPSRPGVTYQVMAAIREDVRRPATRRALANLREALLGEGSPKALRLAQLTNLRLRDVAAWQH